ncbi:hypothetical protein ABB02_00053 [Clostridiaceae bacterium JG1575]|nr:hypothetical protein ABB02_00053 [Clostridiaceae bacterium JG1575]
MNLVIRREGEAAAKYLKERYKTPYLMARPYGIRGTVDWLERLEQFFALPLDSAFIHREIDVLNRQIQPMQVVLSRFLRAHKEESKLVLAGHRDVLLGIAAYAKESFEFEDIFCVGSCSSLGDIDMEPLTDQLKQTLAADPKGFLMGSGELLH